MCSKEGGRLVEIETQQEHNAIVTGLKEFLKGKSFNSMRVWIGLTKSGGDFSWDFSGTYAQWQFTSWRTKEDTIGNEEQNCVAIPVSIDDCGEWVELDCKEEATSLCEKGKFCRSGFLK